MFHIYGYTYNNENAMIGVFYDYTDKWEHLVKTIANLLKNNICVNVIRDGKAIYTKEVKSTTNYNKMI